MPAFVHQFHRTIQALVGGLVFASSLTPAAVSAKEEVPPEWTRTFQGVIQRTYAKLVSEGEGRHLRNEGVAIACGLETLVDSAVAQRSESIRKAIGDALSADPRFMDLDVGQIMAVGHAVDLAVTSGRISASHAAELVLPRDGSERAATCNAIRRTLTR